MTKVSNYPKYRNRSSIFKVGEELDTPTGRVRFIEVWSLPVSRERGFSNRRAIVEFVDTGYVTNCQISNLKAGKVKDRRARTVYGVGYLDSDLKIPSRESGSEVHRAYDLWANMLKRCYTDYDCSYDGVTVDPRWHSFINFLNSLPLIPGYEDWLAGKNVHLDKDLRVAGNKTYCLNSTQFVESEVNVSESSLRRWHGK